MKLAIQHHIVPGPNLTKRFVEAAEAGFTGIELTTWGFDSPIEDYFEAIQAAKAASGLAISSICGAKPDDLVHPEPDERARRLRGLIDKLKLANALGAKGVITLPIRPPFNLNDLSPAWTEHELITGVLVAALKEAVKQTPDLDIEIYLEPLNRYESKYLKTIGHAAELCKATGAPRVQIIADSYHMNIEEAHVGEAVKAVHQHVGHVHLADSNRLEPGKGHFDFVDLFSALKTVKYDGWMVLECGLSGDAAEVLPETVRYIKQCWDNAG